MQTYLDYRLVNSFTRETLDKPVQAVIFTKYSTIVSLQLQVIDISVLYKTSGLQDSY